MSELPDSSAALGGGWPRHPQRLSASAPPGWHLKESITLLEPNAEANVIFSSEPLDPDIDAARYAAVQGDLLREEFPGFAERRFEPARTFGRDGFRRVFEWTPPDGETVTQIQLYFAEAGIGYTATATVTSDDYERHRDHLIGVLGELQVMVEAPADPLVGASVSRYRIDGVLKRRSVGSIYAATDTESGERVALKTLVGEAADDPRSSERLGREERTALVLEHPRIVPVYDRGSEGGLLYMVGPLMEGGDLEAMLLGARSGLGVDVAVGIVTDVGRALDHIHASGYVHLDVTPSNILHRDPDEFLLNDFGLARRTSETPDDTEGIVGTLSYMAPEQLTGEAVGGAADLFALGCVAAEVLTGFRAFGDDPAALAARVSGEAAPPVLPSERGHPRALDAVIARSVALRPEDRYSSGAEFAAALIDAGRGKSGGSSEDTGAFAPLAADQVAPPPPSPSSPSPSPPPPPPPPAPAQAIPPPPPAPASRTSSRGGLFGRMFGGGGDAPRAEAPPVEPSVVVSAGPREGSPVDCSVFGPDRVGRGSTAYIQAFAHLVDQADDARALATEFDPGTTRRGLRRLAVNLKEGDRLAFELSAKGVEIEEPRDELIWTGRAEPVQFAARIPDDFSGDAAIFSLVVELDSVPIGQLKFKVAVHSGSVTFMKTPLGSEATAFKRAFISYATADREAVLGYTQVLRAVGIECFQDVLSLEPGARWEQRLQDTIPDSDLFLLFWSGEASASEWVRREVAAALEAQGDGDTPQAPHIRPVILEGPPPPPPWPELAHLHFNDPILYLRREA